MNFYEYYYCTMITFIALYTRLSKAGNEDLVVVKKGIGIITPYSVGLVLFAKINNTSEDVDFDVEVTPDQCCLEVGSEEDCDAMEIIGECIDRIPRGTTKTVRVVAPLIDILERRGFCTVHFNSKPKTRQRNVMRDVIKIPFDTRLKNIEQASELVNVSFCNNLDEDPLNDCKPVDCESYYNGKRSFFDRKRKRCINIPLCISNVDDDIPNTIYDMKKNRCIVGNSISEDDMKLIKELTGDDKDRTDILIINNYNKSHKIHASNVNDVHKNISKIISNNNKKLFTNLKDSSCISGNKANLEYFITKYVTSNKCTFLVFAIVILVQCILICSMIYCLSRSCNCQKQKVVRQLFNYRHDASVTTPLICTSNVDTETTEYRYLSEPSNKDNKIKCYEACQGESKNNVKMSMSDDIISKCLNRRDWNSKTVKSEGVTRNFVRSEIKTPDIREEENFDAAKQSLTLYDIINEQPRKQTSIAKVNFENEIPTSKEDTSSNNIIDNIVKKIENKGRISNVYEQFQGELSEKEIKCHSYNYGDVNSNKRGFKANSNSKRLSFLRTEKRKNGAASVSTEKGAQAEFSNDSLDDFLSERGMTFLACEDLSKYSLSSQSNAQKSSMSSEVSSRTSKNNVVKKVLSLLHTRLKHGPSSDPGSQKPDSNLNIKLIHMSNASVYSSSNNGSAYFKNLKKPKDSKASL